MLRINAWARIAFVTLISACASSANAQEYPTRPIRIVAPFPVGSGPDANAREVSVELAKILGQTVYVENRPGASGIIGTEAAAKAAPDGYTLYIGTTSTLSTLPHLYKKLPYNAEKDFVPISLVGILHTGLIVNPNISAKDVQSLVSVLKSKPESINVATQGTGSYSHLAGEWFGFSSGTKLNLIPYNGSSVYSDLLAGHMQLMFDGLPAAVGNIRGSKLKLLALTGKARHPAFPDVPTFAEAGLEDFAPIAWQGLLAPVGTPKGIVDKLSSAMQKVGKNPQLAEKWYQYGGELKGNNSTEFAAFIAEDLAMWGKVVQRANIKLD
jgi:tripartite-type tricarboxylate transporter receptor subunit TctC